QEASIPVADDLRAFVAFDLPSTMITASATDIAAWGRPDEEVVEIGLANVKAEGKLEVEDAGLVTGLQGASFCSASHALFLEDYAELDPKDGALVIVPTRNTVVFHALKTAKEAVEAVNVLAFTAKRMYDQGPGWISPSLYWRTGKAWQRVPTQVKE